MTEYLTVSGAKVGINSTAIANDLGWGILHMVANFFNIIMSVLSKLFGPIGTLLAIWLLIGLIVGFIFYLKKSRVK